MELLIALTDYHICTVAKNIFLQYTKWGTAGGTGTFVCLKPNLCDKGNRTKRDFKARIQLSDIPHWWTIRSVFMIKSEMKRNSLDKQAILWSVCLLLANAHIYNTQYLLSICICTHRLVLKHQRLHCFLPLVHTNRGDTIEDVKRLSACWARFLQSC